MKKVLANAIFYTRALGKPAVPLTVRLGDAARPGHRHERKRRCGQPTCGVLVLGGTGFVGRHIVANSSPPAIRSSCRREVANAASI